MRKQRAVFLDRDGVINVNRAGNVRTWQEFVFERGSLEGLARLNATEFRILVITNQSGIGLGHMTEETVLEIHTRMADQVAQLGGRIDRVYFCPHTRQEGCTCRKPSPEMLLRGRDEFDLNLEASYLVGDWVDDVLAARNARVTPLLVRTGRGERALDEMRSRQIELPEIFENLGAAIEWIVEKDPAAVKS